MLSAAAQLITRKIRHSERCPARNFQSRAALVESRSFTGVPAQHDGGSREWTRPVQWSLFVLAIFGSLTTAISCAQKKDPAQGASLGTPIAVATDTTSAVATIESIDPPGRSITLKNSNDTTSVIHCGPKVINFDQFRVGDHVNAVVTSEVAIFAPKPGQEPNSLPSNSVQRPPKGSKPGLIVMDSAEVISRVGVVDPDTRTIVLDDLAGKSRTVPLQSGADLTAVRSGDDVIVRCTQTVSIVVTDSK